MNSQLLSQIEKSIEALPYEDQLKLIERVVHRLRRKLPTSNNQEQTEFERQLEKMAADLQIRTELQSINEEFAQTESDGLEPVMAIPTNVRVSSEESGLPIETVFLCFQIRSLDAKRFPDKAAGRISEAKMKDIEDAVRHCLGL